MNDKVVDISVKVPVLSVLQLHIHLMLFDLQRELGLLLNEPQRRWHTLPLSPLLDLQSMFYQY